MIPILFEPKTTDFESNGLGRLADAVSCVVTEERNGIYELELKYPVDGILFQNIQLASVILADPGENRTPQPFVVYKSSKPLNGIVTYYAEHISYQLSFIPCSPFTAQTAAGALDGLGQNAAESCPYTFWTDKVSSGAFSVSVPSSIRSRLGGAEGSILDVYGGEFEFDRYMVRLYQSRGKDSSVVLRYGKNITDLTQEENIANTITGIYPYWVDSEGNVIELPEKVISSDKADNFPYPRTIPVDFSGEFQEMPTVEELRDVAVAYMDSHNIGVPSVSIRVSFVPLWKTEEYKDIAYLEKVELCDVITVEYERLGVKAQAKIVKTIYDVLKGKYQSLEVGDARASLASTIAEQEQQIADKPSKSFLNDAVKNATNWITGVNGGYVVFHKNANGQPYEILIMDTNNMETAKNVWRWNQNGWGHSSSGYHGPYTMAATIDGGIVADYITAGTMLANRISGGTLTLGGLKNGDGICSVLDSTGNECVRMDSSGINMRSGTINLGNNFIATTSGYITAKQGEMGPWHFWDSNFMTEDYKLQFVKQSDGTWNVSNASGAGTFKKLVVNDEAYIYGSLQVTGSKNRIVDTKDYGKRLLNAYETAEAYFGDIGEGVIGEDGTRYVEIDPIFSETVALSCGYVVFLQAESPGAVYVQDKNLDGFIVCGTPGERFVYEIKGKQKKYEKIRLEKKE